MGSGIARAGAGAGCSAVECVQDEGAFPAGYTGHGSKEAHRNADGYVGEVVAVAPSMAMNPWAGSSVERLGNSEAAGRYLR